MENKINWWWLSYADEETGFLGVVIIAANNFIDACKISAFMGLSPGGEVSGVIVTWGGEQKITLSQTFRRLNKKEATKLAEKLDGSQNE